MGTCTPHRLTFWSVQRRNLAVWSACLAFLVAWCGSANEIASAQETADAVLLDFTDASQLDGWLTVNDPVMGGRSTSQITYEDGLVFSGTISLENKGGFASIRSPEDPDIGRRAAGARSIRVNAVGDGKTYVLKVGVAGERWSHIQRFTTEDAVQRIYELPIQDFQTVDMRLNPAPDAPQTLEPASINQVAIFILDQQQGPFELTVRAIDAAIGQ